MKELCGYIGEEWENTADGKRKMQDYHLTAKGWANFHCKPVFLYFISPFFSHFSLDVLAVHLFLSWELIVSSMGDCWHEENTVIKVRTEDVRLAFPFQEKPKTSPGTVLLHSKHNSTGCSIQTGTSKYDWYSPIGRPVELHGEDHFSGKSLNHLSTKCKAK